ncbi:MAG TPA: hypothetical protein VG295_15450 [Solirubrobacteraceae bacterium]|jgi:hypothetical protein|nr:hypothetical protein [Solirubrobacteraceae bacterium]
MSPTRLSPRSRLLATLLLALGLVLASGQAAFAGVATGHAHLVTSLARTAHFRASALSATASGDPAANVELSAATEQVCSSDQLGSSCQNAVLSDINAARAAEGVAPMTLPASYNSLTVPQQLLVLANLERIGRGLIPAQGLSASLNTIASVAALADVDPNPGLINGDAVSANWAGGTPSPLLADFMWMYDDGPGSMNLDCTWNNTSGCWGHRHDILFPFDGPLIMGAAYAPNTLDGPSLTELFVGGDTATAVGQADALLEPTWATISSSLQFVLSATSMVLAHGAGSGQLVVSASATGMNVSAAITSGSGNWQVSPSSCALAPGQSCALTVTGTPGTAGALIVIGPGGTETVPVSSQASSSLRMTVAGTKITGHLSAGGSGVGGQRVTLYKRVSGRTSLVSNSRTGGGGSVTFHVSARAGTSYGLAFAGSSTLAAASTGPVQVHASRHRRSRHHRR